MLELGVVRGIENWHWSGSSELELLLRGHVVHELVELLSDRVGKAREHVLSILSHILLASRHSDGSTSHWDSTEF